MTRLEAKRIARQILHEFAHGTWCLTVDRDESEIAELCLMLASGATGNEVSIDEGPTMKLLASMLQPPLPGADTVLQSVVASEEMLWSILDGMLARAGKQLGITVRPEYAEAELADEVHDDVSDPADIGAFAVALTVDVGSVFSADSDRVRLDEIFDDIALARLSTAHQAMVSSATAIPTLSSAASIHPDGTASSAQPDGTSWRQRPPLA